MNIINGLLKTNKKASMYANELAGEFFMCEVNPGYHAKKEIKKAVAGVKCIETAKALAVKFNGAFDYVDLEDVLINLIGESEYDKFADENDLA